MRRATAALGLALTLAACGAAPSRFALRAPMTVDDDRRPFPRRPAELYNPPQWDRVDHTLFRQLSELWAYRLDREATNVNALDEVPDSSWFTNRIGRGGLSPARVARGACAGDATPPRPWTVVRAKPAGSSPGLVVESADGRRFLFKIDFDLPERGTAADAIGTRLFWAAGYFTPCNRVVSFEADDLVIAEGPVDGRDPPSRQDVAVLLEAAGRGADGRLRGSLSEFIGGEPLGGWRFSGTRDDDPNDVVPHEHRRELRGMFVLSAWLNHIDTRAENNMDAWVARPDGRGHLRHYVLDVGDSFGQVFPASMLLSQSFGLSHYVDLQHMLEDLLSLGIAERAYYGAERGPAGDVLGYYDVARFDPNDWRNGYPNPAFEQATERDKAWMARILARFTIAHLRAAIGAGRFTRPEVTRELLRVLRGRRARLLERYLTRLSPLTGPEVRSGTLCMTDLAVASGMRDARRYYSRAFLGWPGERRPTEGARGYGERVCMPLPSASSTEDEPAYWVVDLVAESPGAERTYPARVHLYQLGEGRYRVVGLERPSDFSAP